ncbi:MAG TPA: hypothetical protein VLS90_21320 [Thermodesulfobacteriota bacterium]|nr:hypothetical protein [Thermodesulfobacteriota bacterium]
MNETSIDLSGCEQCWPSSPDAAWKARKGLTYTTELIDESHYYVAILACPQCGQQFLSVFTEIIDWARGEDPQYWTVLPITQSEAAELKHRGDKLTENEIDSLGPDRRSLCRDFPSGGDIRVFWGKGITVGFHD